MVNKEQIQNVYACNVKYEEIHISNAESGRKGYFCLGCKKEMQAVKSNLPNRISYFRHDHNGLNGEAKCTYKDETYRHKLAKEILLRIKRIKVPALYKYPPYQIQGKPNLIEPAKVIHANIVMAELYFYENEIGEVCWSKSTFTEDNKYLLFKPDIAFFDKNDNPILLVEIVVTHKLSEKKLLDLKRLGIDAVQVTIPKDSPENIEQTFDNTNRTKWVYNYEQERTEFIPASDSTSEGILSIDEEQRKLFEESYKCRTTQINNLIRTISRCMESQQYRGVKGNLESEISRVEENTKGHRRVFEQQRFRYGQEIERLRSDIRNRINTKHRERKERFNSEAANFNREERGFHHYYVEENEKFQSGNNRHRERIEPIVSEKFRGKIETIENKSRELEKRYNSKNIEISATTESTANSIRELTDESSTLEGYIERERDFIKRITDEKSSIDRTSISVERSKRDELEYGINLEKKYEGLGSKLKEKIGKQGKETELRFDGIYRELKMAIETRNFAGNEYTREFKNILDDTAKVADCLYAQGLYRKYEKAWDCFTRSAYKNWHD